MFTQRNKKEVQVNNLSKNIINIFFGGSSQKYDCVNSIHCKKPTTQSDMKNSALHEAPKTDNRITER